MKTTNTSLKLNDIVNLSKTKDKDLAFLNSKMNKSHRKTYSMSDRISVEDYKKAKTLMEEKKSTSFIIILILYIIHYIIEFENEAKLKMSASEAQYHLLNPSSSRVSLAEIGKKKPKEKFVDIFKNSLISSNFNIINNIL